MQEKDFIAYNDVTTNPIEEKIAELQMEIDDMFPKIQFQYFGLPYMMATYKLHKLKYN